MMTAFYIFSAIVYLRAAWRFHQIVKQMEAHTNHTKMMFAQASRQHDKVEIALQRVRDAEARLKATLDQREDRT